MVEEEKEKVQTSKEKGDNKAYRTAEEEKNIKKEPKDESFLDISLDDKELLNEFDRALNKVEKDKDEFVRIFIFNLLKAKFLLDNYIVHHVMDDVESVGENPWKLQYLTKENGTRYPKAVSTNLDVQKELVHLLSVP